MLLRLLLAVVGALVGAAPAAAAVPHPHFARVSGFAQVDDGTYVTAPPGDGRLFVVRRSGTVLVKDHGIVRTFIDLRSRVTTAGGEQGLFSIAFHPKYAT